MALLIASGLAAHAGLHLLILSRIDFALNVTLLLDCAGFLAGLYLADFFTSLAHWIGDCPEQWHSHYLKGYRILANQHHQTPLAVLQESFWQIRGNIAWLYSPPLFLALFLSDTPVARPVVFLLIALSNGMLVSHSLHKSLHSARQPWLVRMLQALGLIITREYHMRHHKPPYDRNFAALNGWADSLFALLVVRDRDDSRK